jgi:hypothetical protein
MTQSTHGGVTNDPLDTLSYRMTTRPYEYIGGGVYRTGLDYAEWIVNGVPLVRVLADAYPGGTNRDLDAIPAVSGNVMGSDEVDRLLLRRPADLPAGRHSLLVCPECGDTGYSTVSSVIERVENAFVWHTFG